MIPDSGRSLGDEMATHSGVVAWRSPWTESLVGYSPRGCQESDTTELISLSLFLDGEIIFAYTMIFGKSQYHLQKRISCQFVVHSYIVNDRNMVNVCELAE